MLNARNLIKFAFLVGIFGIISDAMLGHALLWENDPYWTYWVTKTFLITTVFALGTAWIGFGRAKGAFITLVHTLILTIYYWTFSPVGLPEEVKWLDLNHTWITGVPVHFLVIYIGYLSAWYVWTNLPGGENSENPESMSVVNRALIAAGVISLVSGLLSSLAFHQFVGITWFIVRILIATPFLIAWYAYFEDRLAVFGSFVLSLVLIGYSHYLGPLGLPGQWRVFSDFTPQTSVYWLNYKELWAYQFPIYLVVILLTLWGVIKIYGQTESSNFGRG
jgi:hypothetical protein